MIKQYKKHIVKYLYQELKNANFFILLNIHKVRAEEIRYFRKILFENKVNIKVFKNKLVKCAITDLPMDVMKKKLVGQIALIWHTNISTAIFTAKTIYNTKKNIENIYPLCGYINGKIVNETEIKYLSNIPNLHTLRAKLLSILSIYSNKIIYSIKYPLLMIINILKYKYKEKEIHGKH